MTIIDILRSPQAVGIIERAARFAAMPVSLHQRDDTVSEKVVSFGQCAACRYVANTRGGREACDASRMSAEKTCFDHRDMCPYICHMGFACVAAPVVGKFVLTFGPFCPSEETRSLEHDVLNGLHNLDHHDRFGNPFTRSPVNLSDIRLVPAATVPEIAQWAVEELATLCARASAGVDAAHDETGLDVSEPAHSPKRKALQTAPFHAATIAASLAAGSQEQARKLVMAALAETESSKRTKASVRKARAVAVLGAVLEAAERAGFETEDCWAAMPSFIEQLDERQADPGATIMAVLGILKRRAVRNVVVRREYIELNEIILNRITEPVTLNEVAAALGQTPTAITHRLQRNFGMSYSEYVGRLRIDKAKELLRRTRLSVTDVGRRVGIADTSNFGKLFRKFEGMTPLEYRAKFSRTRGKKQND